LKSSASSVYSNLIIGVILLLLYVPFLSERVCKRKRHFFTWHCVPTECLLTHTRSCWKLDKGKYTRRPKLTLFIQRVRNCEIRSVQLLFMLPVFLACLGEKFAKEHVPRRQRQRAGIQFHCSIKARPKIKIQKSHNSVDVEVYLALI
jgi:hypothetical protein